VKKPAGPDRLTFCALWAAAALPILYFGTQAVAAPLYPGYDVLHQAASELGSDRARYPEIFNAGVLLVGASCLLAALGYFRGLSRAGANPFLSAAVAGALISTGLASLWAGSFHLPDPRHNPGALGAGMFLFTPFLLAAIWRVEGSNSLKYLLIASLLAVALLAPFMSGAMGPAPMGLLQRLFAATTFLPIAFGAAFLLRRPAGR
jgi:hypothetical membrane protein